MLRGVFSLAECVMMMSMLSLTDWTPLSLADSFPLNLIQKLQSLINFSVIQVLRFKTISYHVGVSILPPPYTHSVYWSIWNAFWMRWTCEGVKVGRSKFSRRGEAKWWCWCWWWWWWRWRWMRRWRGSSAATPKWWWDGPWFGLLIQHPNNFSISPKRLKRFLLRPVLNFITKFPCFA